MTPQLESLARSARSYGLDVAETDPRKALAKIAAKADAGDELARAWVRLFNQPLRRAGALGLSAQPATATPRNRPRPTVRNLIYHVFPSRTNDLWRGNVAQLLRRADVFNGQRTVAIATGPGAHLPEVVRKAFDGFPCGFLTLPNDPRLREVATFGALLAANRSPVSDRATFYAHTKGNSTNDSVLGAEYWRNAMYAALLDDPEACMEDLRDFAAVGTHKMVWPRGVVAPYPTRLNVGNWMFAGTFFWFRNDAVYRHPRWKVIPNDRYGAEAWLSTLFDFTHVKSVLQPWPEDVFPTPNPYNPALYKDPIADPRPAEDPATEAEKIPGFMDEHELRQLSAMAGELPPGGLWVEVGSYAGRSLLATGLALPHGSRLACVENGFGVTEDDIFPTTAWDSLHAVCERLRRRGLKVETHEVDSIVAAERFDDDSLDVVFVDGAHDRGSVLADVRAWLPKVKTGGLLCGHDFDAPEVGPTIDELLPSRVICHGTSIWSYRKCES